MPKPHNPPGGPRLVWVAVAAVIALSAPGMCVAAALGCPTPSNPAFWPSMVVLSTVGLLALVCGPKCTAVVGRLVAATGEGKRKRRV